MEKGIFLQTADTKGPHKDKELRKFEIIKQTGKPMLYDAFENFDDSVQMNTHNNSRHRRASGNYQVELLMMDAVYKNIQTSSYTISIVFASLIISKTTTDSFWTETVRKIDTPRNTLIAKISLGKFKAWVKAKFSSLPVHDHAMLFTRYDLLTKNGSHSVIGLAYVGGVCSESGQSIIEDNFDYNVMLTASHELGHSSNKNCLKNVAPNIDPTALSMYDKMYAGLEYNADTQCKHTYGNSSYLYKWCGYGECTYDVNAPVSNAGQLYDPDTQCKRMYGNRSGLCIGLYNGDFKSICGTMYCTDPLNPKSCKIEGAEEGTQCGNKKWCVDGACTYDSNAPAANDPANPTSYKAEIAEEGTQCGNKKKSSRRTRDKGNVNRETVNHIMVSGNTRTQTTMKIRY
ncbi:metalloprotease mig-17-like [Mytilus edulis]|uniref:metalloprotease mig-17-like n=1 Tax=Mytilus edulis TaxID=6550 RepID=UPI0039EFB8B2